MPAFYYKCAVCPNETPNRYSEREARAYADAAGWLRGTPSQPESYCPDHADEAAKIPGSRRAARGL